MAVSDILNRRVRALADEGEEYSEISGSDASKNASDLESGSADSGEEDEVASEDVSEETSDESDGNEDIQSSINNVSFGALAKAQASLGDRKRKRSDSTSKPDKPFSIEDIRAKIREAREQRRQAESGKDKDKDKGKDKDKDKDKEGGGSKKHASRSSKHAPTVQSSKYAVTRRRTVVEPLNTVKARDPRFDSVVLNRGTGKDHHSIVASDTAAANKNYSFLSDYRASELSSLKEQLKKTKSPVEKEDLKRTITSMEDRQRAFESKQREREIRSQHRKRERELIREGKKSTPYFLKNTDVKREMIVQKFESMGGKQKRRALERRRKKVAGKEKKEMPWGRREAGSERGGQEVDGAT